MIYSMVLTQRYYLTDKYMQQTLKSLLFFAFMIYLVQTLQKNIEISTKIIEKTLYKLIEMMYNIDKTKTKTKKTK